MSVNLNTTFVPGWPTSDQYRSMADSPATVKASRFELDKMLASGKYIVEVDTAGVLRVERKLTI